MSNVNINQVQQKLHGPFPKLKKGTQILLNPDYGNKYVQWDHITTNYRSYHTEASRTMRIEKYSLDGYSFKAVNGDWIATCAIDPNCTAMLEHSVPFIDENNSLTSAGLDNLIDKLTPHSIKHGDNIFFSNLEEFKATSGVLNGLLGTYDKKIEDYITQEEIHDIATQKDFTPAVNSPFLKFSGRKAAGKTNFLMYNEETDKLERIENATRQSFSNEKYKFVDYGSRLLKKLIIKKVLIKLMAEKEGPSSVIDLYTNIDLIPLVTRKKSSDSMVILENGLI